MCACHDIALFLLLSYTQYSNQIKRSDGQLKTEEQKHDCQIPPKDNPQKYFLGFLKTLNTVLYFVFLVVLCVRWVGGWGKIGEAI